MRNLKFICAQPDDTYYTWQVHLWLESLKKLGLSDKAIVLIFIPSYRSKNEKWQQIIDLYPEAKFQFYKDETNEITPKLGIYIPVLRPYCLEKYFREHPELVEDAIFYCDSDVLFTENFNVDKFIGDEDDVNYLSDTRSYINASYFEGKYKDVLPDKLEEYSTLDVLGTITKYVGISKETAIINNDNSGGAQYLLKNIDADFWEKVKNDCITIRAYLMSINKEFFASESKGFQSWCADMWAVLWNLWWRGAGTEIVPEMNFSWASDSIDKLSTTTIYHNAGVTGDDMGYPAFYKGKYHQGLNPLADNHLQVVLASEESKKRCTYFYASELVRLGEKYGLSY